MVVAGCNQVSIPEHRQALGHVVVTCVCTNVVELAHKLVLRDCDSRQNKLPIGVKSDFDAFSPILHWNLENLGASSL